VSEIVDVVVDDREPVRYAELFRAAGAAHVTVERLKVGDFVVNRRWVFERKTIGDLCVSLVDGRLFRQAIRMLQAPGWPVIVLEGGSKDAETCHVSCEAIQGALVMLSVFLGIPVLRSLDADETVRLVDYTVGQEWRRSGGAAQRHGYRPKRKKSRQLYVLQGLPGVGRERAEKLLETFGSVEGVMRAGEDELAAVAGVGKVTTRKIREIVG
jgi:ERCC4-type nuclease